MDRLNLFSFIIIGLSYTCIFARPGQLKEQKYEFQEFHSTYTQDNVASSSNNERLQEVSIPHEPVPWSQQHPNEVNAFAEIFRQNYNRMVAQHNEMMQMHQQTMANMFIPVTYELYHVPVGYTWNSYFGNQQQYVYDETERMSRQLIEDIEQGHRTQQELMNPNFFIEQAASELNKVHQSHHPIDFSDVQVADEISYQQQQQPVFVESVYQTVNQDDNRAIVYNERTNQLEYVRRQDSLEPSVHVELANSMNEHQPFELETQPSVRLNNEKVNITFDQQVEQIEVHTPIFVEMPSKPQQEIEMIKSTPKPLAYHQSTQTNNDEFYGSTYDQQPKYDLQFVESLSAATTSSRGHIMSLVRNRTQGKDISTTKTPTTTTTTTTTPLPTTTSGIMSMLPNRKPERNYIELYQQIQTELEKKLKEIADNETEETHFMGMSSNSDQGKLTYETVNHGKNEKESRGDQGITSDDYNYEEATELEPGLEYHSKANEYVFSSSTPVPVNTNPFYSTALAPFPTTTTLKPSNPYYSAPLAPFPEEMLHEPTETQHLQYAEFSEIMDMNQEVQTIEHHYDHYVEADTIQGKNEGEQTSVALGKRSSNIFYTSNR
ncbi:AAEL014855-PA [Aedes aegypti]|uniref:AAEL014855-PA n=1 Tax=Aedes aegypti TaxID=7159 RepID=Q16F94_AEDAE|nr:AAEL014855-PA [Aedes aegypti]